MSRRGPLIEEPRGHGPLRFADGTEEAVAYHVRVYDLIEEVRTAGGVTNLAAGSELVVDDLPFMWSFDRPGTATLHLEDGRRLVLVRRKIHPRFGTTSVVASGGILPAE